MAKEFERLEDQRRHTEDLVKKDQSFFELAEEEFSSIKEKQKTLVDQMDKILKSGEKEDKFPNEILLEVRAGAGGEEAALFAEKLATMYSKYAETRGC